MKQYKHEEFEFKPQEDKERLSKLEEQVSKLTQEVQQLKQLNAFLMRQDQRSRSSFETIQQRINARK